MYHNSERSVYFCAIGLPSDSEPFAALNADPRVMKHFPNTLSREESDSFIERVQASFDRNGFGFWAVEVLTIAPFIGFVGLAVPRFEAQFTPCVEIGWRIGGRILESRLCD